MAFIAAALGKVILGLGKAAKAASKLAKVTGKAIAKAATKAPLAVKNKIVTFVTKPVKSLSAKTTFAKNLIRKPITTIKAQIAKRVTFNPGEILRNTQDFALRQFALAKFRTLNSQADAFKSLNNNFELNQTSSDYIDSIAWVPNLRTWQEHVWGSQQFEYKEGFTQKVSSFIPNFENLEGYMITIFRDNKERFSELHANVSYVDWLIYKSSASKGKYFNNVLDEIKPNLTGLKAEQAYENRLNELEEYISATRELDYQ